MMFLYTTTNSDIFSSRKRFKYSSLRLVAALGLQVCCCGTLDGSAGCVSEHQDHLGLQGGNAELQAAKYAAFGVGAGVASIAQYEDVTRHCIKHSLQRSTGIRTANDGSVWCLTLFDQGLPHCWSDLS